MKRILVLVSTLIALTALTAACSNDDSGSDEAGTTSTTAKPLTFSDAATPIAVVPGQTFEIGLETTEGTGFEWTITEGPDAELVTVTDPDGSDKPAGSSSDAAGATGVTVFEFKAKASGTTEITFTYDRSFEPDEDPTTETFTINVS